MTIRLAIVSPFYNNSHFIPIQIKSFRKNLKNCTWKLVVIDDSNENTKNILTNEKEDIKKVCDEFPDEVEYIKYPYEHSNPADTPLKHRSILNYMFREVSQQLKDKYDYFLSLDADMVFIKPFDVEDIVSGYDFIGPKRIQLLYWNQGSPDASAIHYVWVHCLFMNLKTVTNVHDIDMNAIQGTTMDTGSLFAMFMRKNPQYEYRITSYNGGFRIPSFCNFEFFYDNCILHFSGGSIWHNDSEKIRTLHDDVKQFSQIVENSLTNKDEQQIEQTRFQLYGDGIVSFMKRHLATEEDLRRFNLF
jgi:glycosyltransferase involved in cell wall biosynthesis